MLVATLITVVVLLGLLTAVEFATFQNIQVQIRDEMAQVADSQMSTFRALPFTAISTCKNTGCIGSLYTYGMYSTPSKLRGLTRKYKVFRSTIVTSDGTAVDLGVRVRSWAYKNMSTAIEIHSVRSQ
jgi:hypothetical protein